MTGKERAEAFGRSVHVREDREVDARGRVRLAFDEGALRVDEARHVWGRNVEGSREDGGDSQGAVGGHRYSRVLANHTVVHKQHATKFKFKKWYQSFSENHPHSL